MALGEVTLRLPRQVGVRITLDKFLSSFDPQGLVRRGTSYRVARLRSGAAAPRYRRDDGGRWVSGVNDAS